jgi:CRISPR-associated protein (TIGR03984 family)
VWRESETRFRARRIADGPTPPAETLEDHQWLWGTPVGETDAQGLFALLQKNGFMLLRDGKQGLVHAPPVGHLGLKPDDRVMLTVRHYLNVHPDTGLAYIADSRLMDLRRV